MARLQALSKEEMNEDQRRIHDVIAAGPRGRVRGPLAIWLHSPKLAETAQALGQYCRYDSSLSQRLSELAILTMATIWKAEFEWWAHKPIALKAGLSEAVADALRDGVPPPFESDEEAIVHEVIVTLHAERGLPDDVYQRATAILGDRRLLDLIGLSGYYTLISMTLNVFQVLPPEGERHELTPTPK
jgi:4-carboxymuconolactone decarboxylase